MRHPLWSMWIALGFIAASGLVFYGLRNPPTSTEAAAWAQAIGTVLAIVGASLIADRQLRHSRWLMFEQFQNQRFTRSAPLLILAIDAAELASGADFEALSAGQLVDYAQYMNF